MKCSVKPRDRVCVIVYELSFFVKNIGGNVSGKYGINPFDNAEKWQQMRLNLLQKEQLIVITMAFLRVKEMICNTVRSEIIS